LNEKSYSGGALYIQDSINGVTSSGNIFRFCYGKHTGGIFTLVNSKLTDKDSVYYNNQAKKGGVIKCTTCALSFTNSQFYDN